jgi:hypothetical protein
LEIIVWQSDATNSETFSAKHIGEIQQHESIGTRRPTMMTRLPLSDADDVVLQGTSFGR